jgi:hypothetical protein
MPLYDILYTHYTHAEVRASSKWQAEKIFLEDMANDPNGGDVEIVSTTSYTKRGNLRKPIKPSPNALHFTI